MTTQTSSPVPGASPIHKSVQEHYGNLAKQSGSCCEITSSAKEAENLLYPREMLAGLPDDVANFTAGSGDPITLARLQPGETVLDLGSGGGLDCFLAARQVGATGRVIGVDMTQEMLERARSAAKRMQAHNVEFREGFLESLPVDDASVDVIISNCVINLSPDKPQVFREMYRVLRSPDPALGKPGGRIAVSDILTNRTIPAAALKDNEDWCGCVSGAIPKKDYAAALEKAGFVDIRIEPDIKKVINAIETGQVEVRSNKKLSKEELLERIRDWESLEGSMFIPHMITARKPF